MGRKKLIRFQENADKENLLEPGKPLYESIKGNWKEKYFHNAHPLVLELACGRGEYTTGLAIQVPFKNFIGVDVKGDRLWKGAVVAQTQGLKNAAFLRAPIEQLTNFFAPSEASEIWLTFPDPREKDRHKKKRLVHPRFLEIYQQVLAPNSLVHLKTDNTFLFGYALEVLKDFQVKDLKYTHDLYTSDLIGFHLGIKTRYELKYVNSGSKIHYLQFRFP